MSLQIIGAGLGRTGTLSLKLALEHLLGGHCYHMSEVLARPEHMRLWQRAAGGDMPDWHTLFEDYQAAVDWPCAAFWPELIEVFPDALVVLSLREPNSWWHSAQQTVFRQLKLDVLSAEWKAMFTAILAARWTSAVDDRDCAIQAYIRHNHAVITTIAPRRLVLWRAEDGWEPLCRALDRPLPERPFPWVNNRGEWVTQPLEIIAETAV